MPKPKPHRCILLDQGDTADVTDEAARFRAGLRRLRATNPREAIEDVESALAALDDEANTLAVAAPALYLTGGHEAYLRGGLHQDAELWEIRLRVRCSTCGAVFRFVGVAPGVGGGVPRTTIWGDEVTLPAVADLPPAAWEVDDHGAPPLSDEDRLAIGRAMERTVPDPPALDVTEASLRELAPLAAKLEALQMAAAVLAVKAGVSQEQLLRVLADAESKIIAGDLGEPSWGEPS